MILLGSSSGEMYYYNPETDEVTFKHVTLPFLQVKDAFESPFDRVKLREDLIMIKRDEFVIMGCLTLTKQTCKLLIKQICNKSKQ